MIGNGKFITPKKFRFQDSGTQTLRQAGGGKSTKISAPKKPKYKGSKAAKKRSRK